VKNGANGNEVRRELDEIRELLRMTALQSAATTKELANLSKEFRADLKASRAEHDREMKEIRVLFKRMVKRIAL
jgi:hypothetical protein